MIFLAVTVKDVARHAGVSPSTVSRVCNNHPSISKETRDRVQRSIQELGYELPTAQDLPQISVRHIGIILPPSQKEAYEKADIVVMLTAHDQFKQLPYNEDKVILDFCGIYKK